MAKGKLNVNVEDLPRLEAAASFNGVELGDGNSIGNKAVVEVIFKQPSSLFETGRLMDNISEEDLESFFAEHQQPKIEEKKDKN